MSRPQVLDAQGQRLTGYNTKLEPSTKGKLDALAQVLKMAGQRELLNELLESYLKLNPEYKAKVDQLVALLAEGQS